MSEASPAHQDPDQATLAASFGGVAAHYERFRPGPPPAAVDWYLYRRLDRVIDLGSGTGALARLLVGRVGEVVAVEPDDRMREILAAEVPDVVALRGTGESMPLPDACADAVIASTSWHWMDPAATSEEVARVLVPGGVLGALWTAPDPDGPFLAEARALLSRQLAAAGTSPVDDLTLVLDRSDGRDEFVFALPGDAPFDPPERETFRWDIPLDADELIGLLGTFSRVITLPGDRRDRILTEARRLLAVLGIEGDTTVDVAWRSDAWRTCRKGAGTSS